MREMRREEEKEKQSGAYVPPTNKRECSKDGGGQRGEVRGQKETLGFDLTSAIKPLTSAIALPQIFQHRRHLRLRVVVTRAPRGRNPIHQPALGLIDAARVSQRLRRHKVSGRVVRILF